ncbi:putative 8-amino-7-oxononanoate synthase, partial [Clarias magur]
GVCTVHVLGNELLYYRNSTEIFCFVESWKLTQKVTAVNSGFSWQQVLKAGKIIDT